MVAEGTRGGRRALALGEPVPFDLLEPAQEAVAPGVRDGVGRLGGELDVFGAVLPQQQVIEEPVRAGE